MSNIKKYYKALVRNRTVEGADEWTATTIDTDNYTGYIQPVSGNQVFQEAKSGESVTHRLYTAVSSDIINNDRIVQDSKTYTVVYSDQVGGITNRQHHKEILLQRFV